MSNFVPKPHTPFQWEPMDREDELLRKRERLYAVIKRHRRVKLKVHDAGMSITEAALSRGDRHVSRAILRRFRDGARFDSWDEHFSAAAWRDAFAAEGIDVDRLVHRAVPDGERLPWDHIAASVTRAFLSTERERSRRGERTPDCMEGRCALCGVETKLCAPARRAHHDAGRDAGSEA